MSGKITITNKIPGTAVIDIEGIIGVPEKTQFETPNRRIATYEGFRAIMDSVRETETQQLVVNIRSTGGDVNDALLILDELRGFGGKITTCCFGYVASAATIIAQAASEGCRELSANSLYLIHRSICSAEGNKEEMERSADILDKTDERIAALYAERSGKPAGEFTALMDENDGKGRWLSPEETLKYGLADRITSSRKISADAAKIFSAPGFPPLPVECKGYNRNVLIKHILRQWSILTEFLGIAPDMENDTAKTDLTEGQGVTPDKLQTEAPANMQTATAGNGEAKKDNMHNCTEADAEQTVAHTGQATGLQNWISVLEAKNARLAALATVTLPKEDPSPQDIRRTPNEEAYTEDIRRITAGN